MAFEILSKEIPEVKDAAQTKLEAINLFRERAEEAQLKFLSGPMPEGALTRGCTFTPFDDKGVYIGKLEIEIEHKKEAKSELVAKETLTKLATVDAKDAIDPSIWVKAWDYITKTKG